MSRRPILTTSAEAPNESPLEILDEVTSGGRGGRPSRAFLSGSAGFLVTVFAATAIPVSAAIIVPAKAQQLAHLNVDPICRGIARHTGSPGVRGGPDLSYRSCAANQLRVRKHLALQWGSFSRAARTNCIGSVNAGGLPSYTELLTCLQIAPAAAHMRASTGRTHRVSMRRLV